MTSILQIVRKKLTPAELSDPAVRWNSGTDAIQRTNDGGTTWVNSPGQDPRHTPAFQNPLLTGTDIRCRAAANITKAIHDSIDAVVNATSEVQAVTSLLAIIAVFLPEIGIFAELLWLLVEALFAIGTAVISAAFTTDVYDQLQCLIYCDLADDGSMSSAQSEQLLVDVNAAFGEPVHAVINWIVQTWGEVGLTNAGTVGDAPHDCSECPSCKLCFLNGNGNDGMTIRGLFGGSSGDPQGTYNAAEDRYEGVLKSGVGRFCDIFIPAGTWKQATITWNTEVCPGAVCGVQVYATDGAPTPSLDTRTDPVTHDFSPPLVGSPSDYSGAWIRVFSGDGSDTQTWLVKLCLVPA